MRAAVEAVEAEHGAVGVLVNNAGYSQSGAIETVAMDKVRDQFETNVFGLVRLCQLVLPGMRRQRWGKIVNLSSMGGRLVFPGGGFYHATKYAVEAISDALRFEVKAFGVDVILIEPGLIRTAFGETASGGVAEASPGEGDYAQFNAHVARATESVYEKGSPVGRLGGPPEAVAKVIEKALGARRPRARYTRHALGEAADRPARAAPRPRLGRRDALPVPAAGRMSDVAATGRARRPRGALRDRHGVHARGPLPAAAVPRAGLRRRRDRGARPVRGLRPGAVRRGARRPRRPGRAARRPPGRGDHAPRVALRGHERVRHPGRGRVRGLRGAGRLHRAAARRAEDPRRQDGELHALGRAAADPGAAQLRARRTSSTCCRWPTRSRSACSRTGRLEWAREECRAIAASSDERDPEEVWRRLPRAGGLDPRERAVARELGAWRERTAMREDRPVGSIVRDPTLVELAKRQPAGRRELGQIRGLNPEVVRRRSADLLEAIERGNAGAADPPRGGRAPADGVRGRTSDRALGGAGACARAGGRAGLRADRRARRSHPDRRRRPPRRSRARPCARSQGWRRELVGAELLELLRGRRRLGIGDGGRVEIA